MKKKHTVIIVPPKGVPIKSFRIGLPVAILLIIIALVGLTGFFVPIKSISNNVAEQNQKKNLVEQNKALLQKVLSSLRLLQNVRTQMGRLEEKKQTVIKVSGHQAHLEEQQEDTVDYAKLKPAEMVEHVKKIEMRFGQFGTLKSDEGNIFDTIPVLNPLGGFAQISRAYGDAFDPFSGKHRFHYGTDFIALAGTPVFAAASGVVRRVEKHPLWGNRITIEHSGSFTTIYAHVGAMFAVQGRKVVRGEKIAEVGMSGLTSGPHVHYEIWHNNIQVDPESYLFPMDLILTAQR